METIHKKNGKLHIYVRQDKYKGELKSHNWVGRTYINGKQKVSSSGTTNLEEAIPILEKWFDELRAEKVAPKAESVPHEEVLTQNIENKTENTEETINNKPKVTFFPRTVDDISRIIKHAKEDGKRVRVAGMRHTWSDFYSDDGEYLVCLLPLEGTDHLTFGRIGMDGITAELDNWGSELNKIEVFIHPKTYKNWVDVCISK